MADWPTLAGRLEELLRRLLLGSQELLQASHGHLGIHQLRDELRQLEEGHPQHLRDRNHTSAGHDNSMCKLGGTLHNVCFCTDGRQQFE